MKFPPLCRTNLNESYFLYTNLEDQDFLSRLWLRNTNNFITHSLQIISYIDFFHRRYRLPRTLERARMCACTIMAGDWGEAGAVRDNGQGSGAGPVPRLLPPWRCPARHAWRRDGPLAADGRHALASRAAAGPTRPYCPSVSVARLAA